MGNVNALKHGASMKRAKREQRDAYRRAAERESREILNSLGLSGHAAAKRMGKRLTDVETEISRLRSYLDARGRHDIKGNLKPAFEKYLELQRQDRAEVRHLLDHPTLIGAGPPREVKHLIEIKRTEPPERPVKVIYVCTAAGHEHETAAQANDCMNKRAEPPPQVNSPKHQRGVRAALGRFLDRSERKVAEPKPEAEQEVEQPQLKFPGSGWPSDNWMN